MGAAPAAASTTITARATLDWRHLPGRAALAAGVHLDLGETRGTAVENGKQRETIPTALRARHDYRDAFRERTGIPSATRLPTMLGCFPMLLRCSLLSRAKTTRIRA